MTFCAFSCCLPSESLRIPDAASEALDAKLDYWEKAISVLELTPGLAVAGSQDSTPPRPPRTECRPQFEGDDAPLKPQRPVDFTNKMSMEDFEVEKLLLGPKLFFLVLRAILVD